jgi:hypothetical protein
MPLPFRPNCLPAALAPLPHRTARQAWDACVRHLPALLPLPLLADSGEDPLRVSVQGFGGVSWVRDHARFDHGAAARTYDDLYLAYLEDQTTTRAISLLAFTEWAARETPIRRADAVCTTLMGPISTAIRLVSDDGVAAINRLDALDALAKHLCLRLEWQHAMVGRSARTIMQWLYEPYFDVVGTPFTPVDWRVAGDVLEQTFGASSGVHAVWVSATTDLGRLLAEPVVDVVGLPLPLAAAAETWGLAIRDFVGRGGVIGWGIIPQTAEGLANARVGRLAARFGEFLHALEAMGVPPREVIAASLIMPEDTLGHLDANVADGVLAMTSQLSGMLRHSYGLD